MDSFYQPRAQLTDPQWFYGRKKELQKLFSYLNKSNPQNVQIVGQRRIGKSWLLQVVAKDKRLQERYLETPDKYTFIYWDLQREMTLSPELFLKRLLQIILVHLSKDLRSDCTEISQQDDISVALWDVMELIEADEHKVILLIDEFSAITKNKSFAEDFFSHLRALFGRSAFTCVTASYLSLGEMCHLGPDSPFFNIFSRIQLELFTKEEAEGFVRESLMDMGIKIDNRAVKSILRLTGPHPCFISQLCEDLYFATKDKGAITREDIDELSADFRTSVFDDFNYYFHRLNENEKAMLRNIAEGNQPRLLEDPTYLRLKRLSLIREDKKDIVPFSIPFSQFLRTSKGTDIYYEKAFSDLEFKTASYILLAENLLKASKYIPESIREALDAAIHTMQGRPQDAMRTCARDVLPSIMKIAYLYINKREPYGDDYEVCCKFDNMAESKVFPKHLASQFHLIRISGNDASHINKYCEACTPGRAFLTVLETIHVAEEVYKRYR